MVKAEVSILSLSIIHCPLSIANETFQTTSEETQAELTLNPCSISKEVCQNIN